MLAGSPALIVSPAPVPSEKPILAAAPEPSAEPATAALVETDEIEPKPSKGEDPVAAAIVPSPAPSMEIAVATEEPAADMVDIEENRKPESPPWGVIAAIIAGSAGLTALGLGGKALKDKKAREKKGDGQDKPRETKG
jgi:hypothetical protein